MTDAGSKFKIAIVGIGGVGGYVGGRLAARYAGSDSVEVVLAARGANEQAIRERGLKLVTTGGEQLVRPKLVSPNELGAPDLIVLATKEYDLEETVAAFKESIGARTAILPLLNGVDTKERIARVLPGTDVWQGCIYIISRLAAPGVIEETGGICRIFFGNGKAEDEKAQLVETLFREAGITDANFSGEIEARIWEKYLFISPLAASTTYFNARIREVMGDVERKKLFDELLAEIKQLARAKNIRFSEETLRQSLDKLRGVPVEATSSMHSDFSRGHQAELQSLVGYVAREARAFEVPTPVYDRVYGELLKKLNQAAGG